MDYKAATRVSGLVTSLTDSKCSVLDEVKLKELKGLLRTNEQLVCHAHGLITDRLAANHSQVMRCVHRLANECLTGSPQLHAMCTAYHRACNGYHAALGDTKWSHVHYSMHVQ